MVPAKLTELTNVHVTLCGQSGSEPDGGRVEDGGYVVNKCHIGRTPGGRHPVTEVT